MGLYIEYTPKKQAELITAFKCMLKEQALRGTFNTEDLNGACTSWLARDRIQDGNCSTLTQHNTSEQSRLKRLPRQPGLPTLSQVTELKNNAETAAGKTIELPFGEAPELYSLIVSYVQQKAEWHWMLYFSGDNQQTLEWNYISNDPRYIHHMIAGQFPHWDLQAIGFTQRQDEENAAASDKEPQNERRTTETDLLSDSRTRAGRPTLEGDLANIQIANLLQSIAMNELTGKLSIEAPNYQATLIFSGGQPIHCSMGGEEGDEAMLVLVGQEDGNFTFMVEAVDRNETPTVTKKLNQLLMESAALLDWRKFLNDIGLKMNSYLTRNHQTITEKLFEQMVSKGADIAVGLQKEIYLAINNKRTLMDVLRIKPLPTSKWVPVMYNLITCGLVSFREDLPQEKLPDDLRVAQIDWSQAGRFEASMLDAQTGLHSMPAFLYFAQREHERFERFRRQYAIIALRIMLVPFGEQARPLGNEALKEVAQRIKKLTRRTDATCYLEGLGFVLMLPETDGQSAKGFAARLIDDVTGTPLKTAPGEHRVAVFSGVSSAPEDSTTLHILLALATNAAASKSP